MSSRSGVATLRTAIHLLLTYLLTFSFIAKTEIPAISSVAMVETAASGIIEFRHVWRCEMNRRQSSEA